MKMTSTSTPKAEAVAAGAGRTLSAEAVSGRRQSFAGLRRKSISLTSATSPTGHVWPGATVTGCRCLVISTVIVLPCCCHVLPK